jgi:hypothetical protein
MAGRTVLTIGPQTRLEDLAEAVMQSLAVEWSA